MLVSAGEEGYLLMVPFAISPSSWSHSEHFFLSFSSDYKHDKYTHKHTHTYTLLLTGFGGKVTWRKTGVIEKQEIRIGALRLQFLLVDSVMCPCNLNCADIPTSIKWVFKKFTHYEHLHLS